MDRVVWSFAVVALFAVGCGGDDAVPADPPGSETSNGSTSATTGGTTGATAGTTSSDTTSSNTTTGGTTGAIMAGGVGAPCASDEGCRDRLVCDLGRCAASGDRDLGEVCQLSAECDLGLYCDDSGLCQAAGEQVVGELCANTSECQAGLICSTQTLLGQCEPGGDADLGARCDATRECLAGLVCAGEGDGRSCAVQRDVKPTPFTGKACDAEDGEEPPARVFFEVPDNPDLAEFYRLPFPNDIRLLDGRPDMAGHTTPGPDIRGVDLVARTLDAYEARRGFGVSQGVFMRFSAAVDFGSLDARGDEASVQLVDITPDSPEYGQRQALRWEASTGRGKYICHHWLNVRPSPGRPLSPNTTYAVFLTRDVRTADGEALEREPDFEAVLAEAQPGEARLIGAWEAYAPLRGWLQEQNRDPDSLLVAAVFTTGDPTETTRRLRQAVRDADAPTATQLTSCDEGVTSPCDDGLQGEEHVRGCFGHGEGFKEVHGLLELPIFQKGEAPYIEGGEIALGDDGQPLLQRTESVCMSMTIPDFEDMPSRGWPVLLVSQGVGGTFRGQAEAFAPLVNTLTRGGATYHMLTLSWEQVLHAARGGAAGLSPEQTVTNYDNPLATVGNMMQATADIYAVLRWLEAFELPAAQSPTGRAVRANMDQVFVLGHDVGGVSATMATPFEPNIRALVLSGTGGQLYRLLDTSSPVQVRELLEEATQDSNLSEVHPFVQLMQGTYDAIDPANYAERVTVFATAEGGGPRDVFFTMGQGDTYSPQLSLETVATSFRLAMVTPLLQPFALNTIDEVTPPAGGNLIIDGEEHTVLGRQYAPEFYNGHDVVFEHPSAREDIARFISTSLRYSVPSVD